MDFKSTIGYMLHHLAFALDSASDRVLQKRFGIGLSQFRILLVLEELDRIPQKQIANELSQTEASISRQIKILARKGMVEIEGNFGNKRKRLVCQTHVGHITARQAVEVLNSLHRPVFKALDDDEYQQLQQLLQKLKDRLLK